MHETGLRRARPIAQPPDPVLGCCGGKLLPAGNPVRFLFSVVLISLLLIRADSFTADQDASSDIRQSVHLAGWAFHAGAVSRAAVLSRDRASIRLRPGATGRRLVVAVDGADPVGK